MGWIGQDTLARNPLVSLLTAPIRGVTSSAVQVSDGLNMILGGLVGCALWLVVLFVEVVLIGVIVGVAAYFAAPYLQRLWVAVANHFS